MKNCLAVFCGLLLCLQLSSQNWLKEDATWINSRSDWSFFYGLENEGYEQISFKSDTIIQGKSCKVLQRELELYNYMDMDTISATAFDLILCEENDRIYIAHSETGQLSLIYDFSMEPGDMMPIVGADPSDDPCEEESTLLFLLESVSSMQFGNITRRVQSGTITSLETLMPLHSVMIIEGIGLFYELADPENPQLFGHLFPGIVFPCFTDGSSYNTRCYFDAEMSLEGFEEGCFFLESATMVSTKEQERSIALSIYPNPFTETITIQSDKRLERAAIYSLEGRLVAQYTNVPVELSLSNIPAGTYLLKIISEKGQHIKKIWKN